MTSKSIEQARKSETEDFDIELAISELNKSVAYLSKMVLQLQRSVNKTGKQAQTDRKALETLH